MRSDEKLDNYLSTSIIEDSKQRFFLLSGIIAAVCLVLLIVNRPAALVIHFLLGKFLYSTSNGAVLFFLVLYIIAALTASTWKVRGSKKRRLWLLPTILLGGSLINIWSFFSYQKHLDLPIKTHFYHWLNNQNSFCYLLHNHTGKTALAFLAKFFGIQSKMATFDTGQVFLTHVPTAVPILLTILLIAALGLYLFYLPVLLKRYQFNIPVFLLYFFSFSGCFKSMVDGGPLTYRFFPSLIVLTSLLAAKSVQDLLHQWKKFWTIIFIATTLPLIILWQYLSPEHGTAAVAPFLFLCVSFLFLLLLVKSEKRPVVMLTITLTATYLVLSIGIEYLIFDAEFFQTIDEKYRITRVDYTTFTATDVSAECQGLKAYEVYLKYDNDPLKPKNLFISDNSDPGLHSMDLLVKPLKYAGEGGSIPLQKVITFQRIKKIDSRTNMLHVAVTAPASMPPVFSTTHATLFSRNNHYCYLHLLGNLFTATGFKEFILIPLAGSHHAS